MRTEKKNILPLVLIASSIFLLLVFQFFWLRKIYEDEKNNLQKDTDIAFRKVMMAMQDSLFRKNMQSLDGDPFRLRDSLSLMPPDVFFSQDCIRVVQKNSKIDLQKDSSKISIIATKKPDSLHIGRKTQVSVFITSNKSGDSTNQFFTKNIYTASAKREQNFIIRLSDDSLKVADIAQNYTNALAKINLNLPFQVRAVRSQRQPFPYPEEAEQPAVGILTSKFYCLPPSLTYQAYMPHYQIFILKKIVPQFLFSIFLIGLTSAAFYLIYANLQRQQRLTMLKNDFISNVTHELKTPVTTVSVAIEALQSFNALQNPTLAKEYLEISKNELNRLDMLVDKIMKMATFESKGVELNLTQIDLQMLINQILKSMKLQFDKFDAKIDFTIESDKATNESTGKFAINADEIHLTNVIYNLLDNALKYGGEHPQIEVRLRSFPDKIMCSVQDKGVGIPSEYRQKIFDKFFRVPTGNIHNIKGYGLGLSYVASVVRQHRGEINVTSELGTGSTFEVTLPR
ncbi:MAG: hypothetical protein EAZ08_06390 [Cytophagales bacterium]|nr:MAG: hypothetical protein EAZ08_06390 [Cytophagales bacterium]